jgi:hypothetical protein
MFHIHAVEQHSHAVNEEILRAIARIPQAGGQLE